MRRSVCNARASNGGQSLCIQISREWSYPVPIHWYHSKGNWLRYNFAADSFYIMKLRSKLLVLYCQNCPKNDKFRFWSPFWGSQGRRRPWLIARWKNRVDFLLTAIELLFLSLTVEKAKRVKTHYISEGVGQFESRFQGEGVVLRDYFLVSRKLDTFCYLIVQTAPWYVQSFWHNTGVTDRKTDGHNCYS